MMQNAFQEGVFILNSIQASQKVSLMKQIETMWLNVKLKNQEARVFESLKKKLGTNCVFHP